MNKNLSTASSADDESTSLLPGAIAIAILLFYSLFTLLPNSNSLMVKWPWVFIWQFGLMLGPLALLFQLWQKSFRRLGHWLDWVAGAWCVVLVLSAGFAQFPHQAVWYGWAAICGIAFLYALNTWLSSSQRVQYLLIFQGGLGVIFSGLSLVSWFFQTVRPYQQTLSELERYGIERSFDLQILTLRNWHPIGHQNYVAGYLLLLLPLLAGLALSQRGWQRFGWLGGLGLSLMTLYSTGSRGGWLGLIVGVLAFIGLSAWQYPRLRKALLGVGLACFGAIALWGISSDRIRSLFTALSTPGDGGELTYRLITNVTGWQMGLDHPIFGAGLGGVTLLYQKYRPEWAGREAELTYQLHSTPAQLWAELGLTGALLTLVSLIAIGYLSWRWGCQPGERSPLIVGVISGLAGYSVYALTDYQLDNVCISGTLIIFVAALIVEGRDHLTALNAQASQALYKRVALVGAGILTAVSIWLYPIHRAWMLSSQGFLALQQDDFASFVTYLEKAHQLAPWEPYYAYQLAWNLGELAYQSQDAQQQEMLRQKSVQWFEQANTVSPNQEFGYSNLGWLLINQDPDKATSAFLKAVQLVPEKKGAYFALGYGLLRQGKFDLAIQSMSIALLQQPILLTSPIWRSEELSEIYPVVISNFEKQLHNLKKAKISSQSESVLHQLTGTLHWWKGEYNLAGQSFSHVQTDLNEALSRLTNTRPGEASLHDVSQSLSNNVAISTWVTSRSDEGLLLKAFSIKNPDFTNLEPEYFASLASELQSSLSEASDFRDWLTQKSPSRQNQNQRLGFGTISRHIDGPLPSDFFATPENVLVTHSLADLFPSLESQSDLNKLIQPLKTKLLTQIAADE